jgi:hypothetical protein
LKSFWYLDVSAILAYPGILLGAESIILDMVEADFGDPFSRIGRLSPCRLGREDDKLEGWIPLDQNFHRTWATDLHLRCFGVNNSV